MRRVLEFNMRRNKLELDTRVNGLESQMLKEEIQEFYEASDLAERIDAAMDAKYVYDGAQLKHSYNLLPMSEQLYVPYQEFVNISMPIIMLDLEDYLNLDKHDKAGNARQIEKIIDQAWEIVCRINAMKVAELDANGKVIKQKDLPDATQEIRELLASMLTQPE